MESNKTLQFNWATINVPTIVSVLGLLWYTATHTERQDNRLEGIETGRAEAKVIYDKRIEFLEMQVAKIGNLEYRMTTSEAKIDANNISVNARLDRFSDAFQDIRGSISALSTSFEVLSTKIDNALPLKKSELLIPPPELARKN